MYGSIFAWMTFVCVSLTNNKIVIFIYSFSCSHFFSADTPIFRSSVRDAICTSVQQHPPPPPRHYDDTDVGAAKRSRLAEEEEETNNPGKQIRCAVCLEHPFSNRPTSTVCGHVFCHSCITMAIKQNKKCPMCNRKLTAKQVHMLYI